MKELEQYIKSYMNILMESWKNDVLSDKNMISKPLTLNQLESLIASTEFIDPDNDDIDILYDPDDITLFSESRYFHDIIDLILDAKNGEIFRDERILMFIDRRWKFFDRLKANVKPFYVFKFDFDDIDVLTGIIKTYMYALDDDTARSYAKKWMTRSDQSAAAYVYSSGVDFKAFFINTKNGVSKSTVIHEFTHYLQDVLDIYKIDDSPIDVDESKLKFLGMSDEELKSLKKILVDDEIWPYANELIGVLAHVYAECKAKIKPMRLSSSMFIEYAIRTLTSEDLFDSDLYAAVQKHQPESADALYVFVACIIFNIKKAEIIESLKEELEAVDET